MPVIKIGTSKLENNIGLGIDNNYAISNIVNFEDFKEFKTITNEKIKTCEYVCENYKSHTDEDIRKVKQDIIETNQNISDGFTSIRSYIYSQVTDFLLLQAHLQKELILANMRADVANTRIEVIANLKWWQRLSRKKTQKALKEVEENIRQSYEKELRVIDKNIADLIAKQKREEASNDNIQVENRE